MLHLGWPHRTRLHRAGAGTQAEERWGSRAAGSRPAGSRLAGSPLAGTRLEAAEGKRLAEGRNLAAVGPDTVLEFILLMFGLFLAQIWLINDLLKCKRGVTKFDPNILSFYFQ